MENSRFIARARVRSLSVRTKLVLGLVLVLAAAAVADVGINSGSSAAANKWFITSTGTGYMNFGPSVRPTYSVSMGAQATTAAMTLSIEAAAGTGFKLGNFCISTSSATAAAKVDIVVQRRTTASSGGVACTNEFTTVAGTGCAISKMDPADSNYGGVGRNGGTPGTAGAVLGQWGVTVPALASGFPQPVCMDDLLGRGYKPYIVLAGTGNGLTITVSAAGAGGLASGAITAYIIAE